MSDLFDTVRELKQDIFRNIVYIRPDSFSDLHDNEPNAENIARNAVSNVIDAGAGIPLEFHYMTAIQYPFETDHFMASRYSDGTFPVWYGSLEQETTLYETIHHMMKEEMKIENIKSIPVITRERIIYHVYCNGILIDLSKKTKFFPKLISEDYLETQKIGKQLYQQGFPGLLAYSARYPNGTNANIFKSEILFDPKPYTKLIYQLYCVFRPHPNSNSGNIRTLIPVLSVH